MKSLITRYLFAICALVVMALATITLQPTRVQAAGPSSHVHLHLTRQGYEQHRKLFPQGTTDNLVYNGGPVMHTLTAYTIFWDPTNSMTASYRNLINRYFTDVGGSSFYNILTQYYDNPGTNHIQNVSTLAGTLVDTSAYPRAGTAADPLLDSDIQAEVQKVITQNGLPTGLAHMYFVFTNPNIESCQDATDCTPGTSHPVYCAYHGNFIGANNDVVIYANMPYDNSSNWIGGCSGFFQSPNGDIDADTEISVISHEHFEAVSDPEVNMPPIDQTLAWYDSIPGNLYGEIGDKCGFIYGNVASDGSNVTLNGHPYIMQEEWSNAANNGTANSGCQTSYGSQPPPTGGVSVTQAWTANTKNKPRNAFKRGVAVRYFGTLNNTGTTVCKVNANYVATGPKTILNVNAVINAPLGISNWYITKTKIPQRAPFGTYTLTVSTVDCNGNPSSKSANFKVSKNGKAPLTNGLDILQGPFFGIDVPGIDSESLVTPQDPPSDLIGQ